MISHSPPIFSHSPPVSFLSDYMTNRQALNYNDDTNRSVGVTTPASRYCRPQVITLASKAMVNNANNAAQSNALSPMETTTIYGGMGGGNTATTVNARKLSGRHNGFVVGGGGGGFRCGLERMSSAPQLPVLPKSCLSRKSCLHKPGHNSANAAAAATPATAATKATNQNNVITPTATDEQCRSRKKVIFADDEGLSLTEVRVMSEPSNVPPYWSMKFLEQITQGLVSPHPPDQWTVDFKQPASDYLTFRQKIESDFVSLENVIVKDEESIVVGTVKVKNIDFQKEVIVRVTWDDWKSQQDIFCTYARAYGPATCAHVVFDTFSFKITLPPSSKRLEFCICYRSQDKEYWDNNNGKNYTITKRSPFYYNALAPYEKNSSSNAAQMLRQQNCQNQVMSTLTEALANSARIESAGSNWLQEPSPYW